MGRNMNYRATLDQETKENMEQGEESAEVLLKSPNHSRPASMVIKKARTVIPAHLIAEAISTLQGLDLRWSGPITAMEMQYVEQYVFAKYPEYCNGLVEGEEIDIYKLCVTDESSETMCDDKGKSPKQFGTSPSFGGAANASSDLDRTQLEPSRLRDILTKKTSIQGNFISIPEIQVRNRALQQCGLPEDEYMVVFSTCTKEATILIGESYPFFRGNIYMTILGEESDSIRGFAASKDCKVIVAPETWLNLRIKGSQLSQYFRRKCKYTPKGLFAYQACVDGTRYSMHWISEAHRNSWHVLLDATALDTGKDRLTLAMHRPDFVLCTVENTHAQPSKITCVLVRKRSFETAPQA